jgi:hypothetical protein
VSNYSFEPENDSDIREQIEYYAGIDDKKLIDEVGLLMSLDEYKENKFTEIIKSIITGYKKYNKLSEKQKMLIIKHIIFTDI